MIIAHDHPSYRPVVDATSAIIFVGTAHNESDVNFQKALVVSVATELDCEYRSSKLRSFASSQYLTEMKAICSTFRSLTLPYNVLSYFETKQTPYKSQKLSLPRQMLVLYRCRNILACGSEY